MPTAVEDAAVDAAESLERIATALETLAKLVRPVDATLLQRIVNEWSSLTSHDASAVLLNRESLLWKLLDSSLPG